MPARLVAAFSYLISVILVGVPVAFFWYLLHSPITDESVFTGPILAYGARMTIVSVAAVVLNGCLLFIAWRQKFKQAKVMALSFGAAIVINVVLGILSDRYSVAHMVRIVVE
jgi:uncharacterized protein YraI